MKSEAHSLLVMKHGCVIDRNEPIKYKVGLQGQWKSLINIFHTTDSSQVRAHVTHIIIMPFTHGTHFLSLLEQPKDSMGGGYSHKYDSPKKAVQASRASTEPFVNGHADNSSSLAPANFSNGHEVEESGGNTKAIPYGSDANVLPESKGSDLSMNGIEVTSNQEPAPHVFEQMATQIPGSTKLQRLLKGSNELIVCPGVYDGFSARIALSVGFQCLYMV